METLILTLPLILVAFARVVEAAAIVILAFRRDAPLSLGESDPPAAERRRLRLRAMLRRRDQAPPPQGTNATPADRA